MAVYRKNSHEIVDFQVESVEFEGSLARNARFDASNSEGVVVVFLWWCGGVFVVVFLWWCFCGGVFVVVFLWWCFCGGVFEVLW